MKTRNRIFNAMTAAALSFTLASCSGIFLDGSLDLPCRQDRIGTVCFENYADRTIKVKVDGEKWKLYPYESLCLELGEGKYTYKVTGNGETLHGKCWVEPCVVQTISLYWP